MCGNTAWVLGSKQTVNKPVDEIPLPSMIRVDI